MNKLIIPLIAIANCYSMDNNKIKLFIQKIYSEYSNEHQTSFANPLSKAAEKTYSKDLLKYIRLEFKNRPEGESGPIDWDPICNCQDNGKISIINLSIKQENQKIFADVLIKNLGSKSKIRLYLAEENNQFLIDDIQESHLLSYKNELIKSIRSK